MALNPGTSLSAVEWVLQDVDMVLIMSVNPGVGGQAFLPASRAKIELLRSQIRRAKLDVDIQVDGGIKAENIGEVAAAGANVIVSGSGIFGTPDYGGTIERMRAETKVGPCSANSTRVESSCETAGGMLTISRAPMRSWRSQPALRKRS